MGSRSLSIPLGDSNDYGKEVREKMIGRQTQKKQRKGTHKLSLSECLGTGEHEPTIPHQESEGAPTAARNCLQFPEGP